MLRALRLSCNGLTLAAAALFFCGFATANSVSLNISENPNNQPFVGGENIGPLETNSSNWNSTDFPDSGTREVGTKNNLVDDNGANSGVSVTWSASNTWFNGDGTGDDQSRMAVGYLDDGDEIDGVSDGVGITVTFSDIPYDKYLVYGLLASDQTTGDPPVSEYNTLDFTVNGSSVFGGTAPAYGSMARSLEQTGSQWSLADGTNRGNYWIKRSTGSTLTITGLPRNGSERGSISAVIVEEIPEPCSAVLLVIGLICGAARSRGITIA